MGQYYYVVSSLPHLYFDAESYPSRDKFMQVCAENLSRSDLNAVVAIDDISGQVPRGGRLKKWFDWNLSLRAELAKLRGQKLGLDIHAYQRLEKIIGTEEVARAAFNQESPLVAEEVLERARWGVLDELEVGHYFDLQKILVYRLKISILERKAQFELDKGLGNFKRIYSTVTETKIGKQPE